MKSKCCQSEFWVQKEFFICIECCKPCETIPDSQVDLECEYCQDKKQLERYDGSRFWCPICTDGGEVSPPTKR